MGGLVMFVEEEVPEGLGWLKLMEEQGNPPLNSLLNICAKYVARNLVPVVLQEHKSRTPSPNQEGGGGGVDEEDKDNPNAMVVDTASSSEEEVERWRMRPPKIVYDKRSMIVQPGIRVPMEVAQKVWDFCTTDETEGRRNGHPDRDGGAYTQPVAVFANDDTPFPLERLTMGSWSLVSSSTLAKYLKAQSRTLKILDISSCRKLEYSTVSDINKYCQNLTELNLGSSVNVLFDCVGEKGKGKKNQDIFPGIKALEKLVLQPAMDTHFMEQYDDFYLRLVVPHGRTLTYLDLCLCDVLNFRFLAKLPVLRTLILYGVDLCADDENGFFVVLPLVSKAMITLDLSQPHSKYENFGKFENPNELLDAVVRTLPNLMSLDISGTNLAGTGVAQQLPGQSPDQECCDIPGLNSRCRRPLEYLGLYGSAFDASHRHCIPAKFIGGDKDELQIIHAARNFIDRTEVLEKMLNDLFHLFRSEEGRHVSESLRLILLAMERHPREKHIQISGSASLFYIVKNNQNYNPVCMSKRRILSAIVNAMEIHLEDATMMRNGCLTICHFKIPHDVMFVYEQLVGLLLKTLGPQHIAGSNDDFNERIAIYLLNSLACQVEGEQKQLVGELGAIQKMLSLIQGRLNRNECDDVMEIAWSTMWNVTDETPENCSLFLEHDGMNLFLRCLRSFAEQPELLRNMMGLLGNVAEVERLRPHLMTAEFLGVFYDLLNSKQDNIEVSYNAAGVLAHILSDGNDAWKGIEFPAREQVCERMSQNIQEWDIRSSRNINYRSFKPILRLLNVRHTMQCRLWAAWALANLTTVYPDKYVKLLEEEDGLSYLSPLLDAPEPPELIQYARTAYNNVERMRNTLFLPFPLLG